jgi:hypothetical protein
LITIPVAKGAEVGTIQTEWLRVPSLRKDQFWASYMINPSLEFELNWERRPAGKTVGTFNLSYNFLTPLTDLTPGLSVGLLDALNQTERGRAAYLAVTYRYGNLGDLNQNTPTELTLGLASRRSGLFFVGVSLPFTSSVRLVTEHDSVNLTTGLEFHPLPGLSARAMIQEARFAWSLSYGLRF